MAVTTCLACTGPPTGMRPYPAYNSKQPPVSAHNTTTNNTSSPLELMGWESSCW
jgi:hypothetical protein